MYMTIYSALKLTHHSLSLCIGQPAMGALLSERNSINYIAETTVFQLVKRDMNSFCAQELTDM